ncbi:MAG: hypothetical protein BAJALOKI3v1_60045 [Promethearchaeota archaeon]|nr:MAG: hypothetical protein BAJALOKI3v1_60045 [Candidatus Lokiarchaeota archaeon]
MNNLRLDLHVHTVYSGDSLIKLPDLIKYVKKKQLDGIAICDHNTIKAYKKLKDKAKKHEFILIPGMEIETHIGEVIGLFLEDEVSCENNNFFHIVNQIRDYGGLVIIPHPFDFIRRNHLKTDLINDKIIKKYIDGVEIMNSRIMFHKCIKKAIEFKTKYNLFETAGSDAHHYKEIGNGYTLIQTPQGNSLEEIKQALLSKLSISMGSRSSPFYHLITIINKIKMREYL